MKRYKKAMEMKMGGLLDLKKTSGTGCPGDADAKGV